MIQSARSGKKNILEGSKAGLTSKETEIKLTNSAMSRTAAGIDGERFSSLIFLSAVCDLPALASPAFAETWNGQPVLVLTGRDDERVPLAYEQECADTMRAAGARVDMKIFDDADHFLFFSQRKEVIAEIRAWLAARIDRK